VCSLLQTDTRDNLSPSPFSLDRIARVCLTLKQSPLPPFSFLVISTRPVRPVFPTSLRTSLKQPVHTQRSHSHLRCQFSAVSRAHVPPLVLAQLFPHRLPQAGFDPHRCPLADACCRRGCPVRRMSELVCACCCASRKYGLLLCCLCPLSVRLSSFPPNNPTNPLTQLTPNTLITLTTVTIVITLMTLTTL
jgi:hypothetical protein